MAITRKPLLVVGLFVAAIGVWLPLVGSYASEFVAVDQCLDSGGSYDYARNTCDHERNHPYIGFAERHPQLVGASPAAVTLSGVLLVGALCIVMRGSSNRNAG